MEMTISERERENTIDRLTIQHLFASPLRLYLCVSNGKKDKFVILILEELM